MRKNKRSLLPILLVIGGGLLVVIVLISFTVAGGYWIFGQNRGSPPITVSGADTNLAADSTNDIERISLADAKAAFELGNAVFVDVRSRESYDRSHIPGALSIPLGELEDNLQLLDKDQWILTYCT